MRRRTGFQARRFARTTEGQLIVAFFVLLYLVGGGLIWLFYGRAAALLGLACMTGGLGFFFCSMPSCCSSAIWPESSILPILDF